MPGRIRITDITKHYNIYARPADRLKELFLPGRKKYHTEFKALNGVSIDVNPGEMLGIIGRNGSGKSTLLKIICGVLKPTSGTVATAGRISALLELGTGFNPEFTGRENAYLNGTLMGFTDEMMAERIERIESFADIGDFIDQPVKKYSSGMYVRLAFACAINVDPDILVVDEALAVGDVFFQQKCYRKIAEFKEAGKTIVLVSHGMGSIQKHCDRAVMLEGGRVAAEGEPREVINRYLESMNAPRETGTSGEGVRFAPAKRKQAPASAFAQKGMPPDRCPEKPSYNPNEYRYGNGKAVIVDYSMTDEAGSEVMGVKSGETVKFRYEVKFLERVESPIFGFAIKTKDGLDVYGINTATAGVKVGPGEPGDTVTVEFRQRAGLVYGDFFVTAGLAEDAESGPEAVDRRYDLAFLQVLPVDKAFGIANLNSGITLSPGGISGREG